MPNSWVRWESWGELLHPDRLKGCHRVKFYRRIAAEIFAAKTIARELYAEELLINHKYGLPNQRAFEERKNNYRYRMRVHLFDLSYINDEFGEPEGDHIVISLIKQLREKSEEVFHFSGCFFVCVFNDFTSMAKTIEALSGWLLTYKVAIAGAARGKGLEAHFELRYEAM
ncbi:MAG: hypothetical protein OEZ10_14000 [Gammaproteobacteria bacterium]|nr:hypothetical protein [Gammaproteobacteria bacterium]